MACFIVPATEAVVTTIAAKVIEKKEKKQEVSVGEGQPVMENHKEHFSGKLKRLSGFLWGGSGLLAFEHLWHGEIQPFFPFLTAAADPVDTVEMLHEMSTVGVSMAAVVTLVWGVITYVGAKIEKREADSDVEKVETEVAR